MYDYLEAVKEDVKIYIDEEIDLKDYDSQEELEEYLNNELFVTDSVTGNASGSYTFNTWEAEENLAHNWDLLAEACEEFGCTPDILKGGPEALDVTIRCYLLGQAISEVLSNNDYFEE